MRIAPPEISSRPAIMRSAVVLPQPDGPTKTTNSPSCTSRSRSDTARWPSAYVFVTLSKVMQAMDCSVFLHCACGRVHDPPLEREEDDGHRDRQQHRGGELQWVAVPGAELPRRELRDALGQRVQARALRRDDEVRELVPRALERQDEDRDERRPRHRQHDRPVDTEDARAVY